MGCDGGEEGRQRRGEADKEEADGERVNQTAEKLGIKLRGKYRNERGGGRVMTDGMKRKRKKEEAEM